MVDRDMSAEEPLGGALDRVGNVGTAEGLIELVKEFVLCTSGLKVDFLEGGSVTIHQGADSRRLVFKSTEIKDVLHRSDKDGKAFIQVNFVTGGKILLTDSLVGFKPTPQRGLDLDRLPKVVTTPDLLSVFEAIEESLNTDSNIGDEVDTLKKVFHAILEGGEAVGFDLRAERVWLTRLALNQAASA